MEGFGERERKPERQEPWGGSPYLWCVRAQWWSEIGLERIFFLMCCFDLLFFVHLFLIFSVLLFKVLISGKLNTLSLVAQLGKKPPAMRETWVRSPGWEDPLEKGKATHSSILAWRIPGTVESMGSQRIGHNWVTFTSLFLDFFIQG